MALLVEREVIAKRRAGSGGEDQLVFRHALVRDAAYSMLTDADRVLGHRLAGAWLERNGERDAMTLAEHFERGGVPDRAIVWFERAAAQAIEGHDLEAAIARAERGITCGAGGSTLGRLRLIQASAHDWRGENVEACDRAAEAFARSAHGSEPWFAAACELAVTYRRLVRRDELRALGEQIAAIGHVELTNGEPLRAVGRIIIQLAISGFREIAEPIARGLARHEALLAGDPGARAWVLARRAMLTLAGGDPTVFVRDAELIIGAADESGDRRSACNMRLYTGIAAHEVGALETSERVLREAIAIADQTSFHTMRTTCRTELANALYKLGRLDEARALLAPIPDQMRAQRDRMQEASSRVSLATMLLCAAELTSAEHEARLATELLAEGSPFQAEALATHADVLLALGRTTEALTAATTAMTVMNESAQMGGASPMVYRVYADTLRVSGDVEAARVAIERARALLVSKAEKFAEPAYRTTFFERVPANAKVLSAAAAMSP